MPSVRIDPIQFRDSAGAQSTDAEMHVTEFTDADCFKRALIRFTLLWLLAFVTLFIPLAHFVLVPGFLIAGPVVAILAYRMKESKEHASGICPSGP